jgi:hypothetical protein
VLASVEAKYQIEQSLPIPPNVGLDLSEQWLVSDCYTEFDGYGDCAGGRTIYATDYIKTDEVVTEGCWRYLGTDGQPCPATCPNEPGVSVGLRDWTIDDYTYAVTPSLSNIKDRIRNIGPVEASLNMTAILYGTVSDGVATCNPCTSTDHAIAIVGYCNNASLPSGGYFIIKNSWGASFSWGPLSSSDGYFKVAYGSCNIQKYAINPIGVHEKTACYSACASGGYSGGVCRNPASTVCCYQNYGAGGGGWTGKCIANISLCNFLGGGCITGCSWCGTSCGYACNPLYTDVVNVTAETAHMCPGTTYPGKFVCLPGEANIGGSPLCEGTYAHCCCEVA